VPDAPAPVAGNATLTPDEQTAAIQKAIDDQATKQPAQPAAVETAPAEPLTTAKAKAAAAEAAPVSPEAIAAAAKQAEKDAPTEAIANAESSPTRSVADIQKDLDKWQKRANSGATGDTVVTAQDRVQSLSKELDDALNKDEIPVGAKSTVAKADDTTPVEANPDAVARVNAAQRAFASKTNVIRATSRLSERRCHR
jgi:DNA polymerase II small subunit/DNA polymerase delta subunit B